MLASVMAHGLSYRGGGCSKLPSSLGQDEQCGCMWWRNAGPRWVGLSKI